MVGLSQLLLKSGSASTLIEDYAACLEMRSEECQIFEDSGTDPGVLIMQVSPPFKNIFMQVKPLCILICQQY